MTNITPGIIYIDDRVGSADMADYLPSEQCNVTRLECADAMFLGNGPEGKLLGVGIEVKAIGDLISSIDSGRFVGHQLPCLQETYDVIYLIIEGLWRVNMETDTIQVFNKSWYDYSFGNKVWLGKGLESWCVSMEMIAGVHIRRSTSRADSARVIAAIYRWFTKEWDQHTALHAVNKLQVKRASALRMVASVLPGIGWKRSESVERHFASIRDMANASVDEWCEIEGIGKGIAEKVTKCIHP